MIWDIFVIAVAILGNAWLVWWWLIDDRAQRIKDLEEDLKHEKETAEFRRQYNVRLVAEVVRYKTEAENLRKIARGLRQREQESQGPQPDFDWFFNQAHINQQAEWQSRVAGPKAQAAKVLGVSPDARPEVIKKAWLDLTRVHHPDRGGNQEMMSKINAAYDVLKS